MPYDRPITLKLVQQTLTGPDNDILNRVTVWERTVWAELVQTEVVSVSPTFGSLIALTFRQWRIRYSKDLVDPDVSFSLGKAPLNKPGRYLSMKDPQGRTVTLSELFEDTGATGRQRRRAIILKGAYT